jgi:serine O-acetyltransferase
LLRKTEYYTNTGKTIIRRIYSSYLKFKLQRCGRKLGYSIPVNVIGPGLCLVHIGTIVISPHAKIGKNFRCHVCVNIGQAKGGAPIIGDNVYVGPGAKIFNPITIADDIVIGANAVVNKSFTVSGITIGGIPAKKISDSDSSYIYEHATKILDLMLLEEK